MGQDIPAQGETPAGGQQIPPAQQAPSQPPLPVPPVQPLPAVPPLPPGVAHWDFYQRISHFRHLNRQHAARATTLTNVAASLTAGLSALSILWTVFTLPVILIKVPTATISSTGTGSVTPSDWSLFLLMLAFILLSFLVSGAALVYSIIVLTKASQLFSRTYEETTHLFNTTSIAIAFAQEDYIKKVQDTLTERTWIKLEGKSRYHSLEDHLDYCACHFPSLRQLIHGTHKLNIWQLRREDGVYKYRKWFAQNTWVYWTCGCLLFMSRVGYIISVVYTVFGGRYLVSRGVLVALCDFMLKDSAPEEASTPPPFKA